MRSFLRLYRWRQRIHKEAKERAYANVARMLELYARGTTSNVEVAAALRRFAHLLEMHAGVRDHEV